MTVSRARVRLAGVAAAAAVVLLSSGCEWNGLNSLPLPGTQGTGPGSYKIYIQMPDVTTLTPNSPVMVNDVSVGTVTDIDVQNWHALLTVSLEPDVRLPANTVAEIGQTSLLGSTHVELAPPTDQQPEGTLAAGDTIPLARAGVYPTTEETLSSLSVVLNGGGFASLGDITKELDTALHGRADSVRDLLGRLTTLTAGLDAQRDDINTALAGLDRLGQVFARQDGTIANALDQVPPALKVLVAQRKNLTAALVALGKLSDTANQVIHDSGSNLEANLHSLAPVLTQLADTGHHITGVLSMVAAFPFPLRAFPKAVRGDYMNLDITYDISVPRLQENFFMGTPLAPQSDSAAAIGDPMIDPLLGPLHLPPQAHPAPAHPAPAPREGRR